MPKFYIDGEAFEFEGNHFLLKYTFDTEVEIPYFCYHPAMSVPTNCRMCLVEVGYQQKNRDTGEWMFDEAGKPVIMWGRKPVTACNTPVSENMFVKTKKTSEVVKVAQEGVLEYMLSNHPLDCPICDQAGECPLQIWTYKHGPEGSRFEAKKTHKPKRVELGPNVILDAERCINCTRCTRFTDEISKSHQLTIKGRGEKNHPAVAPGKTFDDAYSMNVIDLCPVGALTSRSNRFQARVWEMNHSASICTGCSKGCNVDVWIRDNKVLRQTPRENLSINQYWMCDEGRLDIAKLNEARVSGIRIKGDIPVDFQDGLRKVAGALKAVSGKILFIGSAYASLESNFALKELAKVAGKSSELVFVSHTQAGWGDNFLRKDDRTPNSTGVRMLGFKEVAASQIADMHHQFEMVYMLEDDKLFAEIGEVLSRRGLIVHATRHSEHLSKADFVLPAATHIEGEGVFVNEAKVPQFTRMIKEVKQMTPEMWMGLSKSRSDKAAYIKDNWRHVENIHDVLPSWKLIDMVAEKMGNNLHLHTHKDVFSKMKHEVEILKDMKISYKIPKEAFKSTQFEFALR